jgi:hypothetical protein
MADPRGVVLLLGRGGGVVAWWCGERWLLAWTSACGKSQSSDSDF